MATNNLPEEKQIIKFIEKTAFSQKNKKLWIDQIRSSGFNEELAGLILKTLTKKPPKARSKEKSIETDAEKEKEAPVDLTLHAVEFNGLVRRWRLALQSKKFSKR